MFFDTPFDVPSRKITFAEKIGKVTQKVRKYLRKPKFLRIPDVMKQLKFFH